MSARSNYLVLVTMLGGAAFAAEPGPVRYTQTSGSTLSFTFSQLGAATEGGFGKFHTVLSYDERNLAASSLEVTIQIASANTQDAERDGVLASPDLFDAAKHPTATFKSTGLARGSNGRLEARGRITLRGVTRDIKLPIDLKPGARGLELSGETTLRRLDFGIGQGDFRSTDSVGDEVRVRYRVQLMKAP